MNSDDLITARLDSLLALTPIPAWARAHDWALIEAELGITLPAEYKAYADRFPSGIHRRLDVFHPDTPGGFALIEQVHQYARMFDGFKIGRTFYPQPGGLIPWAEFDSDAALCWLPDTDNPDLWPVVACASTGEYEDIPGSTLEALVAVLRGDAGRDVFPGYFYNDPLDFLPTDPHISVEFGILTPADIGE
jgi:hypothetical protein